MRLRSKIMKKVQVSEASTFQSYDNIQEFEEQQQKWSPQMLKTSYVPDKLIERDDEKNRIYKFIKKCQMNEINSKILFILGAPGIGKTSAINEVTKKLSRQSSTMKKSFHFINCMTIKKPEDIYQIIYNILLQATDSQMKKVKKSQNPNAIDKVIEKLKKNVFFVIDEFDFLVTKDQRILYNLSEWASEKTDKLGFILVANTAEFIQNLSNKVRSRMGDQKIIFKQYNHQQIKLIIEQRLKNSNIFNKKSLDFVSSYISKKKNIFTSDIRQILEFLEIVVQKWKKSKGEKISDFIIKVWSSQFGQEEKQIKNKLSPLQIKIIQLISLRGGSCFSDEIYIVLKQKNFSSLESLAKLKQMQEQGMLDIKPVKNKCLMDFRIKLTKLAQQLS